MRSGGARRVMAAGAACGFFLTALAACGGERAEVRHADVPRPGGPSGTARPGPSVRPAPARVPGIGERLWQQVPVGTRQVVAVYGEHEDSPDSTLVLYEKRG